MSYLVSVIIPCYNAERWIAEAIDSCLNQTYPSVEIIVIDDGSIDNSLEIVKSYGNKVIWETGENKGGNHARNRGFALSKGEYIQFLDADDYILPEKIARQVGFLEENDADVVYGDWRHRQHLPSGETFLEDIKISGAQEDILESLLADWWVSPACILFSREVVEKSGGWDESLRAGQDRDFFLSVAMDGARVAYQPGCHSVYRRYGKNYGFWLFTNQVSGKSSSNSPKSRTEVNEAKTINFKVSCCSSSILFYDGKKIFSNKTSEVLSVCG